MAILQLNRKRLRHNYNFLDKLFKENNIEWAIVTKILCGNELFIQEVLDLGIQEVCDSRLSNLKKIKSINPNVQTVYIKPPPSKNIENVIKYADVSFNSESSTIQHLSDEAVKQNKIHKITIMIELGDLREGIMGENLLSFYEKVTNLPNIEITSIGANLNCLHGVMPSQDKLIQLSLYKQLIEAKFDVSIPWITGGTSVVLPLVFRKQVPKTINHFRIGETLFFGNDLFSGQPIPEMASNVFMLSTEIIEITKKPIIPIGELTENPSGDLYIINEEDYGKETYRAIIDVGLLDISPEYLTPEDPNLKIVSASSDMLILNIGLEKGRYEVGELVTFSLKYMGALRLLNSDYIDKMVSNED